MGGAEPDHRQPVRIGAEPLKPRSESSISRRIFRRVKRGFSSGVNSVITRMRSSAPPPPLIEDAMDSNSQNSASTENTAKTLSREEGLMRIGELLGQITQKNLFWEHDVKTFFLRVNEIFDEKLGPTDECNQNCCKAVIGMANFLFIEDGKWLGELRGFGAQEYFRWAAMNSSEGNVSTVAVKFLVKMEGVEAIHTLTGGQVQE